MSEYKHRMSLAVPQALDKVVMWQGDKASTAKIMCAIDFEPLIAFADMGLTITGTDEVRYTHIGLSETYNGLIT